jgi:hypothetical protein
VTTNVSWVWLCGPGAGRPQRSLRTRARSRRWAASTSVRRGVVVAPAQAGLEFPSEHCAAARTAPRSNWPTRREREWAQLEVVAGRPRSDLRVPFADRPSRMRRSRRRRGGRRGWTSVTPACWRRSCGGRR